MLSLILATLLQAGAPADPASPPAAPGQTVTVAPVTSEGQAITYGIVEGKGQPKPKKVCFNDAQSGSKIPVKRCMNRKEFEQQKNDARDQLYRIQSDVRSPGDD